MTAKRKSAILLLLLVSLPSPSTGQPKSEPSPLETLSALESRISTSWRNGNHAEFQADLDAAMEDAIPRTVLKIVSKVFATLKDIQNFIASIRPNIFLQALVPIFSIVEMVADVIGLTVFSEDKQFADLYTFLQERFVTVNAMIESNFHAISDLQHIVECGQVTQQVVQLRTRVNAFFSRYEEMMRRAETDRGEALKIFDAELPQYQNARVLLELRHLLMDKSLYAKLITHCARGSVVEYTKMAIELHHAFKKAIILDTAVKIRLHGMTKDELDTDRAYWRGQVSAVVTLMVHSGQQLIDKSWYNFYISDIDRTLSDSALQSASDAAGRVDNLLSVKYPFIRTAVLIIPRDAVSITISDAFGNSMRFVNQDSFVCHRSNRANGDSVMVLCRSWIKYQGEATELQNAYASYSRGVLSLSLVDALRNDRWDDLTSIMSLYSVSFFAVKIEVKLGGSSVSAVQSKSAADLVFCHSHGGNFRALVIAKLVKGVTSGGGSGGGKVVQPRSLNSGPMAHDRATWITFAAAVLLLVVAFWPYF